ncbi:MAG: hypothetical protein DMF70_01410 [Acidobacteria bacterium]|nr:MAG: hypothetical protein DMF70_01410 [Acidobacteriota bacterium]
MRQRLAIVITVLVVLVILIGLNAASYVKVEQPPDSEQSPDRSTFNSGATGTRALYDLLQEAGYQVARWREPPSALLRVNGPKPGTLVVVGRTLVRFTKSEREDVLRWVENGGRLVLIDRNPDPGLLPASDVWTVATLTPNYPSSELDPTNLEQMTAGVKPLTPSQPTAFARQVETVLPSRFAAVIMVLPSKIPPDKTKPGDHPSDKNNSHGGSTGESAEDSEDSAAPPTLTVSDQPEKPKVVVSPAPVVHFEGERGALLVDYPHGQGRIVLLSDPFVVANNGVSRADNLQLAINVVAGYGGLVAFDEFHQGHAATHNALIQYFQGTPVMGLCGQLALIGLAIVWSRGRRFARPLPLPQIDRRSSLEFVASMAELQQRAKAHDLALENIYGRVRRSLVRHAGLNNSSPRAEIAARVAARSGLSRPELESLMRKCEETINGAPTNGKETLRLVKRLRQIESRLGLGTRARDVRQAAETL